MILHHRISWFSSRNHNMGQCHDIALNHTISSYCTTQFHDIALRNTDIPQRNIVTLITQYHNMMISHHAISWNSSRNIMILYHAISWNCITQFSHMVQYYDITSRNIMILHHVISWYCHHAISWYSSRDHSMHNINTMTVHHARSWYCTPQDHDIASRDIIIWCNTMILQQYHDITWFNRNYTYIALIQE